MFAPLNPPFKASLRQAEAADTRLDIRREEKDAFQDGRGQKQSDDSNVLWDDETTVSIEALVAYVSERLHHSVQNRAISTGPVEDLAKETLPPVSAKAARAMKAYGAVAAMQVDIPASIPQPSMEETSVVSDDPEDAAMHDLIQDLDILSSRGVDMLTLERGTSFLASITQAVRIAMAALPAA